MTTIKVLGSRALAFVLAAVVVAVGVAAAGGCGGGGATAGNQPAAGAVTFWQDVAPIYDTKCVRCHQQGGIAPFRLDNFADAKAYAPLERARVDQGTMPPYFMQHDGTCGSFHDETTLTAAQKATIDAWVDGGLPQGTPATLTLPAQPALAGAVDVTTPVFQPVAQGGQLALHDEYRCFLFDAPNAHDAFLTGYDVTPGEASIVHHVITFIVDPQAKGDDGRSNAEIMQALDDDSPDRAGWPCFGGAGEAVEASGLPVTWAPGQGVVEYPAGMGVPLHTSDKLVVQVHYNLADPGSPGKSDSTAVHLRFADSVARELAFLLPDPFLESLGKDTPDMLPAGQRDASYTWMRTGADLGIDGAGIPWVDLIAVMPHMHGRGLRQTMSMGDAGALACAAHIDPWNFHWQEFYFYETPPRIAPGTQLQVECEYDTSADTAPVMPGWGTQNEMCLAVLMVALPPS